MSIHLFYGFKITNFNTSTLAKLERIELRPLLKFLNFSVFFRTHFRSIVKIYLGCYSRCCRFSGRCYLSSINTSKAFFFYINMLHLTNIIDIIETNIKIHIKKRHNT